MSTMLAKNSAQLIMVWRLSGVENLPTSITPPPRDPTAYAGTRMV